MTDDLVKRLRDRMVCSIPQNSCRNDFICEQAADRIDALEAKLERAVGALASVIDACNEGRIIPRPGCGIGGMTIEANIRGSMYTGVPAWPIEEALITLAELKEQK